MTDTAANAAADPRHAERVGVLGGRSGGRVLDSVDRVGNVSVVVFKEARSNDDILGRWRVDDFLGCRPVGGKGRRDTRWTTKGGEEDRKADEQPFMTRLGRWNASCRALYRIDRLKNLDLIEVGLMRS